MNVARRSDSNFSSFLGIEGEPRVQRERETSEKCLRETSIAVKRIYRGTRARFTRTVERIMTLRGSGSLVERKSVQPTNLSNLFEFGVE